MKGMRLPTEFEWEAASEKFDWWPCVGNGPTRLILRFPASRNLSSAVGEYNGKFMINQMVLRGASVMTPPGQSRNTYRNFSTHISDGNLQEFDSRNKTNCPQINTDLHDIYDFSAI
jgi:hypothetical protein